MNLTVEKKETNMVDQTERMYELMRVESNRLKTFQMNPPWPKDYVDIKKLAKAGFFYAFSGDRVHCAFCRGQVCRWDRDDDPMTEHARHFTTCPFIMGGEVGNEPLDDDPFPGPKRPRPYDVCGIQQPNVPSNDATLLVEAQPQFQEHNQNNNQQELQQNLYIRESANQQPVESNTYNMNNLIPLISQYQQDPDSHHAHYNLSSNTNNSSSPPNSLTGICKICYTNSIELGFLPCGHMSCLSCAQRLHSCPFCRSTITTRMRFYV